MAKKNEKELEAVVESQETEFRPEEQLSSLDMLWRLGFDELDSWAERFNKRDDLFLEAAKSFVERVRSNQENIKAITEQFNKELKEWEKGAREELLVTTTSIQQFFPIKSYEEINQVVDDIQTKTTSLFLTPFRSLTNGQAIEKYLETLEQYISFRKKGREKYVDSVKKTTNVVYENQKIFANLFAKQVKSAMFPFQQYMKGVTELTKK
ncbi:hypothetical protein PH210_02305 [Paenibacillus sp. BSR1-1]|uniref:hypothetical protein n=1 Tax=Paenibacillus sp. BSR1-1 TaxID=3020845 RepID=UPI0025AF7408|nr:hypothetical protein [Paenibacillus sp. BSR1-1]MDN3015035.1 hypothetical protein [Paenibacillus sp. BSR1-1]